MIVPPVNKRIKKTEKRLSEQSIFVNIYSFVFGAPVRQQRCLSGSRQERSDPAVFLQSFVAKPFLLLYTLKRNE
jgi:hypothetical protein